MFLESHVHYSQGTMETARRTTAQIPFNNLLYETGRGRRRPTTSGAMYYGLKITKNYYYNIWSMNSANL
jgi:hypothetical protein